MLSVAFEEPEEGMGIEEKSHLVSSSKSARGASNSAAIVMRPSALPAVLRSRPAFAGTSCTA